MYFCAVPLPADDTPPIEEPSGDPEPVDDPVLIGCVIEADGAGVLDPPPHAVGCSLGEPELDPLASFEPEPPDPAVTTSGCAPLEASEEAADAEGGGTVRSLWQ